MACVTFQLIAAYHQRGLSGRRIDQLCLVHLRTIGFLSQNASAAVVRRLKPALKLVNEERVAAGVRKKAEERVRSIPLKPSIGKVIFFFARR
jgi:hypothetical protein